MKHPMECPKCHAKYMYPRNKEELFDIVGTNFSCLYCEVNLCVDYNEDYACNYWVNLSVNMKEE